MEQPPANMDSKITAMHLDSLIFFKIFIPWNLGQVGPLFPRQIKKFLHHCPGHLVFNYYVM
tara:strand:- start:1058 stop:1240 length:183 start_codon:yes stop_codon:yes gene_type:complete